MLHLNYYSYYIVITGSLINWHIDTSYYLRTTADNFCTQEPNADKNARNHNYQEIYS